MTKIAAMIVLLLLLAGCLGLDDGKTRSGTTALEFHEEGWAALGIEDYAFRQKKLCFCPEAAIVMEVVVRGGAIESVTDVDTDEPLDTEDHDLFRTVEGLFEFIHDALDRNADRVVVRWDSDLHYPVSIDVDYSENALDDEIGWAASDLVAHRD